MLKKYFLILLNFPLLVTSQVVSFSDVNLKNKLLQADTNNSIAYDVNYNPIKVDINNNYEIEISEALFVKGLNISNSNINNLNGLEFFSNMLALNCNFNNITNFNFALFPNLLYFSGNNNLITSLSINNNNTIDTIRLDNNNLNVISITNCNNLWGLNCSNNNLNVISITNCNNLWELNCSNNILINVNLLNFPSLHNIYFDDNLLTTFTFNNCPNITNVQCSNNLLTTLDFSNLSLLNRIQCFDNQLNSINLIGCTSLQNLFSSNNNLSSIDCSSCSSLDILDCQNNQITYLNVKNGISETSYAICGNPNLNYICVDNNAEEINHMKLQIGSMFCNYSSVTIDPNCILETNSLSLNFEIFPNPTQNILNIKTNSSTSSKTIKIYNNIGQLVINKIIANKEVNFKLDVSLLTPGIYFTFIDSDKRISTKKFIKN